MSSSTIQQSRQRYVIGFAAERELPIVGKIAAGSLRNKLLFLLPALSPLSYFLPGRSRRFSCLAAPTSATRGWKKCSKPSCHIVHMRTKLNSARLR